MGIKFLVTHLEELGMGLLTQSHLIPAVLTFRSAERTPSEIRPIVTEVEPGGYYSPGILSFSRAGFRI